MIFFGVDAYGSGRDIFNCGGIPSISTVSICNGAYDSIYFSNSTNEFDDEHFEEKWTENTLLFADFDKQTLSGFNFEYGDNLHSMKLLRRELGYETKPWVLLYEQLVKNRSINFVYHDYFARGRNTQYEYALVPVLDTGVELPYIKTTIESVFYGAIITDGKTAYHILLDPEVTETERNRQASVVTTLNSKYPFVFFGGKSNYTTGSFSGTAIRYLGNDEFDVAQSHWYREDMIDWLTNGEPKILKIEDGRIWMIVVNGNVKASNSEHPDKVTLSFDFVEIGNVNNTDDINNNGFANVQTVSDTIESYKITVNLYYVTINNNQSDITEGASYSTILTADVDYEISGVIVNMGGVNVTAATCAKNTDGTYTINIPDVTGNISIVASATRVRVIAQSFALTESSVTLLLNNTHKLEWTTYPTGAHENTITWASNNESIVSVTKAGVIEGLKTGSARITATMDGITATCNVTVTS